MGARQQLDIYFGQRGLGQRARLDGGCFDGDRRRRLRGRCRRLDVW